MKNLAHVHVLLHQTHSLGNLSNTTTASNNSTNTTSECSVYLPSTYTCHSIPDEVVLTVYAFILLINFLGNGIVIIVIVCKRSMQTFTNYLILNLSIADVVIGIICVAMETPMEIEPHKWLYGKVGCNLLYPIQTAMVYVSVFILVVLSCSRYIAIVHPYRTPPSSHTAKVVLLTIWIISFLLVTPYALSLQFNEENGLCEEKWTHAQAQVFTSVTFALQYVLPIMLIMCAYALIVYDLNNNSHNNNSNSSNSKRKLSRHSEAIKEKENTKITKLLIIVTTAFALCLLPHHTIAMWLEFGDGGTQKNIGDISILAYFMLYLNSGLDPVLYNVFNSAFRTELCKLNRRYYPTIMLWPSCIYDKNDVSITQRQGDTQTSPPVQIQLLRICHRESAGVKESPSTKTNTFSTQVERLRSQHEIQVET